MVASQRFHLYYDEESLVTMVFEDVLPQDAGLYTVVAKNTVGHTQCAFHITVDGRAAFGEELAAEPMSRRRQSQTPEEATQSRPPIFSPLPDHLDIEPGQAFTFSFTVFSFEKARVRVVKNDISVTHQSRFTLKESRVEEHLYRYELTCDRATEADDGTYEVLADNSEGAASATVEVLFGSRRQRPSFTKKFPETKVAEGNQLLLEVSVAGYPRPRLLWYHKGQRILPSAGSSRTILRQKDTEGALAVAEVTRSLHEGLYQVTAENLVGSCSHVQRVLVHRRTAKFLERLRDVEVYENEKTLLVVKISSLEEEVTWFKDGRELTVEHGAENDYQLLSDGHYRKLLVGRANVAAHQGEYTVVIGDAKSREPVDQQSSCSADLVVIEMAPEITRQLKDVNILAGEEATFSVELSKGDALLQWFKDGRPLLFDGEHFSLSIDGKQQKVVVSRARLEDAGEYSCQLTGTQSGSRAKLLIQTPSTEFIRRLEDEYRVDEECDVLLEVEISRPDVPVYWYKNGEELKETANIKFIVQGTVRKLLIRRSKIADTGEYICLAKGDQTKTNVRVCREPLVFAHKLKDLSIKEGETATLSTELLEAHYKLTWFRDETPLEELLQNDDRLLISESGKHRKLIIRNARPTDKALYTAVCEGQRCSSKLSVLSPPRVLIDSRRFTAAKGDYFALDVPFEGYPVPKVEWYSSGRLLKTSKKVALEILMSRTVLTIKQFDEADVGLYKLRLENSVGQFTTHFELFLIDRPEPPPSKPVAVGVTNNSLILRWEEPKKCNGAPITNYIVEYREAKATAWKEYDEEFIGEENVRIRNCLKHNASYVFRVSAVNKAGRSGPSAESDRITMAEGEEGEAPTIVQRLPATIHTTPFGSAKLECKIAPGKPAATLSWKKDGQEIESLEADANNFILKYEHANKSNIASLLIKEVRFDLAGKYEVAASNEHGEVRTSTTLVVEEKPYARFDAAQTVTKVKQASKHEIFCELFGYPQPEVAWYKGGVSVDRFEGGSIRVENNLSEGKNLTILRIEAVTIEHSGIYTLVLTNSAGEAKYDFEVKMLNRPGPPELPIRVTNTDDHSVEVSWSPPKDDGGSPITFYRVELCETKRASEWRELTTLTANHFSHKIFDLISGSRYRFRVCSLNEFGVSDPSLSEPIVCRSPFDRPSPPRGPLRTSDHRAGAFTLYWNAPETDGNCPILEYTVELQEIQETSTGVRKSGSPWRACGSTPDGETRSLLIDGLTDELSYHFRITARNRIGTSDPYVSEEPIMARCRFSPPTAPVGPLTVSEMTNTSLTLTWEPPQSTGGLELTGYVLERKLAFEQNWIREAALEPDVTQYTVQSLLAKYEYSFRVRAENALGSGPPLEAEAAIGLAQSATPPGVPSAPLEMRSVSPSAIIIEWGKPETDGGAPLTGYVIAAREARRTMWMEVGKVGADVHRLQIKDLQEGRSYQVRVLAVNEIGMSDPLESEEAIQVVRPPGKCLGIGWRVEINKVAKINRVLLWAKCN